MKYVFTLLMFVFSYSAVLQAEETTVDEFNLPGASMRQEKTYEPSKEAFESAVKERMEKLDSGDPGAMVNRGDSPKVEIKTEFKTGLEFKGIGSSSGKIETRTLSADEMALEKHEQTKDTDTDAR